MPMFTNNSRLTLPTHPADVSFSPEVVQRMNKKLRVTMILGVTLKPAYKFEKPRSRNGKVLPKIFKHKGYDIVVSFMAGGGTERVNDYDVTVSTIGKFKDLRTQMIEHYDALGESLETGIARGDC